VLAERHRRELERHRPPPPSGPPSQWPQWPAPQSYLPPRPAYQSPAAPAESGGFTPPT
jgi:hypothetical protein